MDQKPYLEFHTQRYLKDTRILSLENRGLCTLIFLYLREEEPEWEISGTIEELGRIFGTSPDSVRNGLNELQAKNIFHVEFPPKRTAMDPDMFKPSLIKIAITEENKSYGW